MTCTIIINHKEHKRNLPVSWDQVDFETFLKLEACGQDIIKVISVITRIEYETLLKAKIINLDKVVAVLGFLNSPAQPSLPPTICGYPIPKNLEFEELQQYVDLKNYVEETKDKPGIDQLRQYTMYCAVFACKAAYGKYDWQLAEKMREQFMHAPCTEVMGIGNFTLLRLIALKQNMPVDYQTKSSRVKNVRLALTSWIFRMVSHLHWTIWSKRLDVKKKKS